MKNHLINKIIVVLLFFLGIGICDVNAQYIDDIYTTPTKAREKREQYEKQQQELESQRSAELEARRKELKKKERQDRYYYDIADESGFSEYEIDAYNRRVNDSIESIDNNSYKSYKKDLRKPSCNQKNSCLKNRYAGKYSDRINRFYNDDVVVLDRGDKVVIITDDSYFDYDDYEYYNDNGVNVIVLGNRNPWDSFYYNSPYYPWYDSWYYTWYRYSDFWYFSPWHWPYRRGYIDPWYYHSSFGWGYYGGYPTWNRGYYSGYNHGYYDGYYDGFYNGYYGYDPYNGSYYNRNYYKNGRRGPEALRNRNNISRKETSVGSSNWEVAKNSGGRVSRATYDRGNFWTNPSNRTEYNTNKNRSNGGRLPIGRAERVDRSHHNLGTEVSRNTSRKAQEFGRTTDRRINNSSAQRYDRSNRSINQINHRSERVDRSVYRQPRRISSQRMQSNEAVRSSRSFTPSRSHTNRRITQENHSYQRSSSTENRSYRNNSSSNSWGSSSSSSGSYGSGNSGSHHNSGGRR